MKLGVLLCDDVRPELQKRHGNYPDMFATLFGRVDPAVDLHFYRVIDGQYPAALDECDAYISSGSKFSVNDEVRWISTFEAFIHQLYQQDMKLIATLVLFTVVIVPAVHLLSMLYILIPLQMNLVPRYLARVFRTIIFLKPWGMMEVFMLGILVSVVKLAKMATIIPGVALYAFLTLIFVLAAMAVTLDEHLVWDYIEDHLPQARD